MLSTQDLSHLQSHFCPQPILEREDTYIAGSRISSLMKLETAGPADTKKDVAPSPRPGWRFLGAFACLCVINFICAIDATILSVALPIISTALRGTAIEAFWAGTSFLLASTVFQPSWASLSHIFGRKPVLLFALIVFTVGAITASVANNSTVLLVGRSIQGIGGGGLVALTYVVVTDMVTLRERGKWFSLISLQWALGSIAGPVCGGAFAERSNWRWIFWMTIPFCVIAFVTLPLTLRLQHKTGSILEKLKAFDWVGSLLFIASLTSLLIPLTWGGVMFDWSSWHTVVPLVLGAVGLVVFVLYSKLVVTQPLIRGSIFSTSTGVVGYLGTFIHGIIVWSLLYYLPLYYELAKDMGPTETGVAIFPLTFTTAPAAVVVGLIIAKTGKYRLSVWIGWFLTVVGMGLMILINESSTTPQWVFLSLVPGFGLGMLYTAQSFAVQASASSYDLPFAAAMYSFFRSFGQTFGVAIGGVIFQNRLKNNLLNSTNAALATHAEDWAREASSFVQIAKALPNNGLKQELIVTYVDSLRAIWIVMTVLAGMAFLLSLGFIKEIGLDRELETEQGFIHESTPSIDEEKAYI